MPLFLTCLTYVQGLYGKNIEYELFFKEFMGKTARLLSANSLWYSRSTTCPSVMAG
jgi:hypothetical protein